MADDLTAPSAPSPAEWRGAMGYFPTGVTVCTSWRGETPLGSTINAFCSVSLDPPLLLICLAHANPLTEPVRGGAPLGVNILPHENGQALARHFALSPEDRRFEGLDWLAEPGGAPRLVCAPVFIDCQVEQIHDAGDHLIVVGRGLTTTHAQGVTPLLYHRGAFPGPLADR
ncbi:MAG TPA: flavin reductase family protein [Caulobacteraceae bacterium]|jgi:3-hydroxy-9,10-secoandrosta-1,3,5(10)-triene-9,17-dione monooxygenase reductase component|nr:flavin reductase family protein [Caulobacteraceae bacterium]